MSGGPQPRITDINRPFWDGCRANRLMLQRCTACSHFVFYPRACCPFCGCGDLAWQQASGEGRLQSWTVVHRPGHDAFIADAPYVFAAVTLAEGPILHGRMLVPPNSPSLTIGGDVRVVFPTVAEGVVMPAFVAASGA